MPFSQILFLVRRITTNLKNVKKLWGKEKKSDYTKNTHSYVLKKASVSASLRKEMDCSVTVEAVFCIPLFLYAAVCLIWMLELRALQLTVRSALDEAGKKMSVELAEVPLLLPSVLEADIENIIGEERLESSFIVDGIHCEKSYAWTNTGIMELKATYKVKLPFPHFIIPELEYQEALRRKIWNGYAKNSGTDLSYDTIVYITDTGVVYHKDYNCTYLEPSVKAVGKEEIQGLRNQSGGKYYPCGLCAAFAGENVYITDYGDRYHSTLYCSRIKRNIYAVSIQEVKGKGACSKCGK